MSFNDENENKNMAGNSDKQSMVESLKKYYKLVGRQLYVLNTVLLESCIHSKRSKKTGPKETNRPFFLAVGCHKPHLTIPSAFCWNDLFTKWTSFWRKEHSENVMGYSIWVDQYHFTDWYRFNRTTGTTNFTDIWATELYNHTEPTVFFNDENINIAGDPDIQDIVGLLRKMLQAGWRAAMP